MFAVYSWQSIGREIGLAAYCMFVNMSAYIFVQEMSFYLLHISGKLKYFFVCVVTERTAL
jgi:hypothetical protein